MLAESDISRMLEKHKNLKWQYFEKLVAFIFDKNGFDVRQNVVLKLPVKRQFDVIAEGLNEIFLVECKKWKSRRYSSSIKRAAMNHKAKCQLFAAEQAKRVIPLLVTLFQEEVKVHEDVLIVPVEKLNFLINSLDETEINKN